MFLPHIRPSTFFFPPIAHFALTGFGKMRLQSFCALAVPMLTILAEFHI